MGVSLALATACGSSEYGLVSPVASEDGASHEASGKRDNGVPSERSYSVSPDIEQADFLFVVDPSVSMLGVLKSMREGFRSLEDGGFSRNTQIAVMTTTPASADGSRPHFSVADVEGAMRDPGFQRLIRGSDIAAWKGLDDQSAEEACGEGWFSPRDTLADGTPCLEAITTLPLYKANAEAGLIALKQFLVAQGENATFRDGSVVNIVFVSDTHDPGLPEGPGRTALLPHRPDYSELVALIEQANVPAGVKVHAIAPMEGCVNVEDFSGIGTSYYDVAMQSGGRIVDVCSTNDYSKILSDIVAAGGVASRGVLDVGQGRTVSGVEMNGKKVDWTVRRDGLITVDKDLAAGANNIRVIYGN